MKLPMVRWAAAYCWYNYSPPLGSDILQCEVISRVIQYIDRVIVIANYEK